MRNARAHKLQWSGPTVHSSTVSGACSHRKILKSTILEMLFFGTLGYRISQSFEGCEIRGRHDFLVDYFRS